MEGEEFFFVFSCGSGSGKDSLLWLIDFKYSESLQDGPLPVLSRVITPFLGVNTPFASLESHL